MKLLRNLFISSLVALTFAVTAQAQQSSDYPIVEVQTNKGSFQLELNATRAPLTVQNFLEYVASGQYEGTVFHRVVPGFVVQGGGFDTDYKKKETRGVIANESGNGLSNRRGTVAMARTSDAHSADAQFYINLGDNLPLDPRPTRWGYAVFGKVIEGMDNIDQIGYAPTGAGPVPELVKDVPTEPVIIESIRLLEQPEPELTPAPETE